LRNAGYLPYVLTTEYPLEDTMQVLGFERMGRWGFSFPEHDAAALGEELIAKLEARGIKLHGSSRLPKYVQQLRKFRSPDGGVDFKSEFHKTVVAWQEVYLLDDIFYGLTLDREPAGWEEKFQRVLKGDFFPNLGNQAPRNEQAELLVAAMLKQHGYQVEFREHDNLFMRGSKEFGVEAKRPEFQESLEKITASVKNNAEIARDQIAGNDRYGVVFFELTLLAEDAYRFYQVANEAEAMEKINLISGYMTSLVAHAHIAIREPKEKGNRVLGVSGFVAGTVATPERIYNVRCWSNLPHHYDGQGFYTELEERFSWRSKTPSPRKAFIFMKHEPGPGGGLYSEPVVMWPPD
jgi:hypothetical protein